VLLLGLVEMGHAFNSYMTVVAAARDAARLGAQIAENPVTTADENTMKDLVTKETSRLENAPIDTDCNDDDPGICFSTGVKATGNEWIQVRVCYNHSMIIGVPGVGDGPINMCSQTRIRLVNP
jgi:Flp pilus assembly protein TadG